MESQNKNLWLDADGVLLEYSRPFLEFIKSPVKYEDLVQYDLSNLFDGDVNKMIEAINEFNKTSAYANLNPLISKEELEQLKKKGWELNLITQVDGHLQRFNRIDNVIKVFGPRMFTTIRMTKRGESKAQILRTIEPYETINVVEDNPEFFKEAKRLGGFNAMAIRHSYNQRELKALEVLPVYVDIRELVRDLLNRE